MQPSTTCRTKRIGLDLVRTPGYIRAADRTSVSKPQAELA